MFLDGAWFNVQQDEKPVVSILFNVQQHVVIE